MSEPMSSLEIEDVLASIRRLVSGDLRAANNPGAASKLMLTPALRVVSQTTRTDSASSAPDAATSGPAVPVQDWVDWIPNQSTLSAVADQEADHLDFGTPHAPDVIAAPVRASAGRSAMESAAAAFHGEADDEFILSWSDSGNFVLHGDHAADLAARDVQPGTTRGHAAVFAVLTGDEPAARLPATTDLYDAEGGAPVEEDPAEWSDVAWDDPQTAATASVADDTDAQDDEMSEPDAPRLEPLILPFISSRRAAVTDAANPDADVVVTAPVALVGTMAEPLILSAAAAVVPGDVAVTPERSAAEQVAQASVPDVVAGGAAQQVADTPEPEAPAGAAGSGIAERVVAEVAPADQMGSGMAGPQVVPAEDAPTEATATEMSPEVAALQSVATEVDLGPMLPAEVPPDAPVGHASLDAFAHSAQDLADASAPSAQPDPADALPPVAEIVVAPASADAPEASPDDTAPKINAAAKLAKAAFTRWPGWAQSDPDGVVVDEVAKAPEPPPSPIVTAPAPRRKAKHMQQDLTWADRAEAEIHRQLAAELGQVAIENVGTQTQALQMSEAALCDLVRNLIREELSGKLGERITQNVRKLVQLELQKTMSLQVSEFRSQRRDPDTDA